MPRRLSAECEKTRSRLFDLFENVLTPSDRIRVEAHLSRCEECGKVWEGLRLSERALLTASADLPSPGDLRPAFYARLQQRTAERSSAKKPLIFWGAAGTVLTFTVLFLTLRPPLSTAPQTVAVKEPGSLLPSFPPQARSLQNAKSSLESAELSLPDVSVPVSSSRLLRAEKQVRLRPLIRVRKSPPVKLSISVPHPTSVRLQTTNPTFGAALKASLPAAKFSGLSPQKSEKPAEMLAFANRSFSPAGDAGLSDAVSVLRARAHRGEAAALSRASAETPFEQTEATSLYIQDTERNFEAEAHVETKSEEHSDETIVTIEAGEQREN